MGFFFFFDKSEALANFSSGFNAFLLRKNLKVPAVAKDLGLNTSSVYVWKSGRGFPDFQTLFKLFEMGMTLKEMFGERLALTIENSGDLFNDLMKEIERLNKEIKEKDEKIIKLESEKVAQQQNAIFENPEFKAGVKRALEDLKKNGLI